MRTSVYYKRASKKFLAGTRCKTPCEAVESGTKTLLEWSSILEEERNKDLLVRVASVQRKQRRISKLRPAQASA
jgi:GTP cyclohydrolase III